MNIQGVMAPHQWRDFAAEYALESAADYSLSGLLIRLQAGGTIAQSV